MIFFFLLTDVISYDNLLRRNACMVSTVQRGKNASLSKRSNRVMDRTRGLWWSGRPSLFLSPSPHRFPNPSLRKRKSITHTSCTQGISGQSILVVPCIRSRYMLLRTNWRALVEGSLTLVGGLVRPCSVQVCIMPSALWAPYQLKFMLHHACTIVLDYLRYSHCPLYKHTYHSHLGYAWSGRL